MFPHMQDSTSMINLHKEMTFLICYAKLGLMECVKTIYLYNTIQQTVSIKHVFSLD